MVQRLWANGVVPVFNGPDESTGKMYYKPGAKAPLSLNKYEPYNFLTASGDWIELQILDKRGWVKSSAMLAQLPDAVIAEKYRERREAFNSVISAGKFKALYAGVQEKGDHVVFFVNDNWHRVSRDTQEAWTKKLFEIWVGMGAVRYLDQPADHIDLEVTHVASKRVLAKWGSILGYRSTE